MLSVLIEYVNQMIDFVEDNLGKGEFQFGVDIWLSFHGYFENI